MRERRLIIAVDGYSSTGKSTVSKLLAARLGYTYIDTGAMYRMVTYKAMREGLISEEKIIDEERLKKILTDIKFDFKYNSEYHRYESYMNGEYVEDAIRRMDVADHVSLIATFPYVRDVLAEKQREMACQGGVIMDGRDIGSVVLPHADIKFFLTADPSIRAERRFKELTGKGETVSYEEVEENVRKRDYIDEHRKFSPLTRVPEAILIDTGHITIAEEVEQMLKMIEAKYENRD